MEIWGKQKELRERGNCGIEWEIVGDIRDCKRNQGSVGDN